MSLPLRIVVSLGLLALVIAFADWSEVWRVLRDVRLDWAGAALLLAFCDRLLMNARWQILLTGRGVALAFGRLLRVQLAANFLGSFLPASIGVDAVRIAALARAGHPVAPVVASTLVDRASIVLATLVFGSAAVVLLAEARVPAEVARFVYAMTAIGLIGCAVCLHPAVRRWVRAALVPRVPERFREPVTRIAVAALAYAGERRTLAAVGMTTVAVFAVRILFAKSVALACGVDIPIADLLLVVPILWIAVMLPVTIGGIGVQDASYVVLMALIGIAAPVAVSMSLVEHVVTRLATLPGVLFLSDVARRRGDVARRRGDAARRQGDAERNAGDVERRRAGEPPAAQLDPSRSTTAPRK
ncbi:MAG: flippase-like domain-containing protein [Gammaproteobacteria bacterium]|nr:flippase-like domain-containing protein [Gammaproteobacteria bacterium]